MSGVFRFDLDQRVRLTRLIRNDGTYPGLERGAILARPGETGVVLERGFFLNDVVYAVLLDNGRTLGVREPELAPTPETDAAG
ncbi:MAG: nitrogen fixation protein NifZ [Firmicutes bacterium]|nr:nitrogen fixation protein NifZ [Bacillota bacterium]